MPETTRTVMIRVDATEQEEWRAAVTAAAEASGRALEVLADDADPALVDYLVYNVDSGLADFTPFTRLRVILNTWAGVEAVIGRITWPDHVPFCRMVEPGLTEGMVEYLTGHALRYHLDIDRFVTDSANGVWNPAPPPLARDRTVGILGLGALGSATANALLGLGFRVTGWSRGPRQIDGVDCHYGADGLAGVLSASEILIVILPLTPDTRDVLNSETLAMLPKGAAIINAGRGPLIDDDALLGALASGQIRHATLDVFREEPLPEAHRYWRHPRVTVTPHIAAVTRASTAASAILRQIERDLDGEPVRHIVDSTRGY